MKTVEFLVRFTAQVSDEASSKDISDAYISVPLSDVKSTVKAKFIEYETMDVQILEN